MAEHKPVPVLEEHIATAKKEDADHPELISVKDFYPSAITTPTGGYIFPSWFLPFRFGERLITQGIGSDHMWCEENSLIHEMIANAIEHGNQYNLEKRVLVLWHCCNDGKTVLVVDEGERDFDPEKAYRARVAFAAAFGKDDATGLDYLAANSKEYEFYCIVVGDRKKGTLLKIVLRRPKTTEGCSYLGHQLLT